MININFNNSYSELYDEYQSFYQKLALCAYDVLRLNDKYEISVTFVDNIEIHRINKEYRFKDYATDVISFENDVNICYNDDVDLGDVFISVDKAIEQANEYQHSLNRELSFLFIHGLLHCLGYDHINENDEREMMKIQEVILDVFTTKKADE